MKLKGTRIKKAKEVTVDIDRKDVVRAVIELFDEKYARRGEYIRNDKWQKFLFVNGHNGDEEYEDGPEATKQELRHEAIRKIIMGLEYEQD